VFFCSDEIDWIVEQSRVEGTRQHRECRRIVESAECLVDQDLSIVREGWLGGSRWACVNCGTRDVEIRRDEPAQGRCLRCGTMNNDTEFRSWWVVEMHSRSLHQIFRLTWAYVFTGRRAFADRAMEIMLEYAQWLPLCPIRETHLRFSVDPQLDMRFAIILTYCYDLLYDHSGWSEPGRRTFEESVLLSTVELTRRRWPDYLAHNMYVTGRVMLATVGACLGDVNLVAEAMCADRGFLRHLRDGVYPWGLWHESTLNYHMAMVRDFVAMTEVMFHAGFDMYNVDRYREMYAVPLRLAERNAGVIPGWGDGLNYSFDQYNESMAAYETFHHRTGDPYIGVHLQASARRGRGSYGPLFVRESWRDTAYGDEAIGSETMDEHGMAALRCGDGCDARFARLNYLREIGSHRQRESLELVVHALGGFVGPKLVNCDYFHPLYEYYHSPIGHNTVCLPGEEYDEQAGGEPAFFAAFDDVAAMAAEANGCYRHHDQVRVVALMDDAYFVDVFHVEGSNAADIDWVWHCKGHLDAPAGGQPAELDGDETYRFLDGPVKLTTADAWSASWRIDSPDTGMQVESKTDPFIDRIDWAASSSDYAVRIRPDGSRVRVYWSNNPYPMPGVSPVWTSIHNRNTEYTDADPPGDAPPVDGTAKQAPDGPFAFRISMAGARNTECFCAAGPGYGWKPLEGRVPVVLARRHGAHANFMTALDAYETQPHVLSIETLVDTPGAAAVCVETRVGRDLVVANFRTEPISAGNLHMDGRFAVVSMREGAPNRCLMVEGASLKIEGFALEAAARATFVARSGHRGRWVATTSEGATLSVQDLSGLRDLRGG